MTAPDPHRSAFPAVAERIRLDGIRKQALETGRNRLLVTGIVMALAFVVIAGRLVDLTVLGPGAEPLLAASPQTRPSAAGRADIVDRNGVILATSLPTASLYADPGAVLDAEEAARELVGVLPRLDPDKVLAKLRSKGRFVWLSRNLTPEQTYQVNRLGLPGLSFQQGERRIYPHGSAGAHVLGYTDVDGRGIAGIEKQFDHALRIGGRPLRLSLDLRVQSLLHQELSAAVDRFRALGGAGLVLDAQTGEVLAMVSLPDFDPNFSRRAVGEARFNRASKGVYEMGSTFKLFTVAMALDSGTVSLTDGYDASKPLRAARFSITDYHGKNRWLSVPEILVYSSNIGAAKMAIDVGTAVQRDYLSRLGLLSPPDIELPEVGTPLVPQRWRDINTMTIGYGHGIAVSPLQVAAGVATVVNGGIARSPTLLRKDGARPVAGKRVLAAETSRQVRRLMRLVVSRGTGRNADVPGYLVGGKTGTADKLNGGTYLDGALISSFVGAFPMSAPSYVVLVVLDEPQGDAATRNYATGGWIAAPVVGRVVARLAPLMGIVPVDEAASKPKGPLLIPVAKQPAMPSPAKPRALKEPLAVAVRAALADLRERAVAAH